MTAMPSGLRVHLNGRLVPLRMARVSVFDRGFLFGDGVYETLRTYAGRLFRIGDHLERLAASARALGFRLPVGPTALAREVAATVAGNRFSSARVRIMVSRGPGRPELGATRGLRPTRLIYALPYAPPHPEAYRDGVRAVVTRTVRNDRRAVDPAIKASCLLNNLFALREAAAARAHEAILLNPDGYVAEAASANVFFVKAGVLCTPALACGVLAGVTRGVVLDLARRLGIPVREGRFRPRALVSADEAFVSASTVELLPIAALGAHLYPRRRPVTRVLQEAYRVTIRDELGL